MIPLYHFAQLHLLNFTFVHYDDGSANENGGKPTRQIPPPYNLDNVIAPTALFVGAGDTTADSGDNHVLSKDLPNVFHYEVAICTATKID